MASKAPRPSVTPPAMYKRSIRPFTAANCTPITVNSTRVQVSWGARSSLEELAGQTVRFRFWVRSGRLYSFWVSKVSNGASGGYVAAGGPTFTDSADVNGG